MLEKMKSFGKTVRDLGKIKVYCLDRLLHF